MRSHNTPTESDTREPIIQEYRKQRWAWRHLDWPWILRNQNWASFVLLIVGALIPFIILWKSGSPHQRIFTLDDSSISYPIHKDTVPAVWAVLVPWACFIANMLVCEFILVRRTHQDINNATSTALHFFLDGVCAFFVTLLFTEIFKHVVGRPRPNFLDNCQPVIPGGYNYNLHFPPKYGPVDLKCTGKNSDVDDARKSFPSGHASMASVFCFYNAGYLLYTIYVRQKHSLYGDEFNTRKTFWQAFRRDVGHTIALVWILGQVGFAWGVSASRVIDYKHHVSDVLGGILLGMTIGIIFVFRAIPTIRFMERVLTPDDNGNGNGDVESQTNSGTPMREVTSSRL